MKHSVNIETKKVEESLKKAKLFNMFELTDEQIIKQIPYIFFLTLLAIIYIANTYYSEKTIREIDVVNNEIKELRSEYISSKSELMFKSKQSEVVKSAAMLEIKESTVPPKKIILRKNQEQNKQKDGY